MTALNQQVLPTFFRPTGQLPSRFLSWGLGESLHTSVCVRFRLALFSAILASNTLRDKTPPSYTRVLNINSKQWHSRTGIVIILLIIIMLGGQPEMSSRRAKHLLIACSSSVMPVSLKARLDSSRLSAMALWRSSLSSPVRSITSETRAKRHAVSFIRPQLPRRCKCNVRISTTVVNLPPSSSFKRHLQHVGIITGSASSYTPRARIFLFMYSWVIFKGGDTVKYFRLIHTA